MNISHWANKWDRRLPHGNIQWDLCFCTETFLCTYRACAGRACLQYSATTFLFVQADTNKTKTYPFFVLLLMKPSCILPSAACVLLLFFSLPALPILRDFYFLFLGSSGHEKGMKKRGKAWHGLVWMGLFCVFFCMGHILLPTISSVLCIFGFRPDFLPTAFCLFLPIPATSTNAHCL